MNRNVKKVVGLCLGTAALALAPAAWGASSAALAAPVPAANSANSATPGEGGAWPVVLRPAVKVAHASQAGMLATTWAGPRAVAVGAHGVVLLSDDQGKHWRQAASVPLDATLTGVSFVDDKEGWAVGQAGVVLHSRDGGERWEVQRSTPDQDRPLFAVHFFDRANGVAVGLWSLVLTTSDGGQHWTSRQLEAPAGAKRADLNLFGLFSGPGNALYAAAEKGYVLHSADKGQSWHYLATGYAGSFWTGAALPDGALLVGGLRGALYRSADAGQSWTRIDTGSTASITGLVRTGGERGVLAVGQDGLTLRSVDDGATFQASYRHDRLPLNAVLPNAGFAPPLMSARGPVPAEVQ
ncbi:YCF48-related protein [Rugamonas apoptosis]|uniref:Glycosyl hydrolase n=1 Tax=Rugamonas apoptosis TaxID=2758570 RepID=A0A7W2F8F7_9BURK|nr:YCF48-related protein [Rugamonas apoptosis]MBA5687052.1 glycosyl hydrolase [Rugamonas apoptosis]